MRKLFKHICMICLALAVAVGSFFVPIRKPNRSQMASANDSNLEYYSFTGSNYVSFFNSTQSESSSDSAFSFQPYFYYSVVQDAWVFDFSLSGFVGIGRVNHIGSSNSSESSSITISRNAFGSHINTSLINVSSGNSKGVAMTLSYGLESSGEDISEFNGQIYKLDISHFITDSSTNFGYCIFRYYDVHDVSVSFIFYTHLGYLSALKPRTIYFNLSSLSNNQIYQDGYNAGYSDSIIQNKDDFYNDGYDVGFDDGKALGKTEGVAEANDYSFISLFGGLFDAPVAMLMGLLNFEFLGINLWAFVTSLFTLALVLFIVKLIMGR